MERETKIIYSSNLLTGMERKDPGLVKLEETWKKAFEKDVVMARNEKGGLEIKPVK